jgi:hypothetical protein
LIHQALDDQQARDRDAQHQPVEKKPDDRRHDARIDGERLQQLGEFAATADRRPCRVGGRRYVRLRFGASRLGLGSMKHSNQHFFPTNRYYTLRPGR